MAQLIPYAAAAITFFYSGGNVAATQFAFVAASAAVGIFGPKPNGPGPGDLAAPQIDIGAVMPRVYGRVRLPLTTIWISNFRATEIEQGGKGAPEGPSSYTYSADVLGILCDGSNVLYWTRIFRNQKLVATQLSASDEDSLEASLETDAWEEVELFDGDSLQQPWSIYEDAEGAGLVPAYRDVCTFAITDAQCGTTKNLPVYEVEVVTSADIDDAGEVILFRFDDDESEVGGRTVTVNGTPSFDNPITVFNGSGAFAGEEYVTVPVTMGSTGSLPITLECWFMQSTSMNSTDINCFINLMPVVGGSHYLRLGWRTNGFQFISDTGEGVEYLYGGSGDLLNQWVFVRACFDPADGQMWLFVGGNLVANAIIPTLIGGPGPGDHQVLVGQQALPNNGTAIAYIDDARITVGRLRSTSSFIVPAAPLPYDPIVSVTPTPVDLADIVTAELSLVPGLDVSDYDVTDLVGVEVTGFKAVGPPSQAISDLADIYYFDLIPGAPMAFRRRSASTNFSITAEETGAGVDNATDPFAGLRSNNDDEIASVVGLTFPNINRAHDVDFTSGDRSVSEGPNVRRVQTNVVLTRQQARERAVAATLLARARGYGTGFSLSDTYAASEPGDVFSAPDILGNTQSLRLMRITYSDCVRQCEFELNDLTGLADADLGVTETEEVLTVAPTSTATMILIDGPLLRDEDDGPGFYAAVTITGTSAVTVYGSTDDSVYTTIGTVSRSATTGTCSALGDWTGGWVWDEINSVTVTLANSDLTLASSTHDAMYEDEDINAALIGAHGRWELIRFRTPTLVSSGVYRLTGLMRGLKGTEFAIADHAAGDTFVLLTDSGLLRVSQLSAEIGAVRYFKAVPNGRVVSSVAGQSFTCMSECLEPRAVVDIRAVDGVLTWDRRTRMSAPPTGEPPLGEASESYQVELYDALDALVSVTTVDEPRMPFGQAAQDGEVSQAMIIPSMIDGVLYGIWDWGTPHHDRRLIGRNVSDDSGTYLSPSLCNGRVDSVVYVGTTAYVAATDITPSGVTDQTYLRRIDLSAPSAIAATWSPAPYDQLSDLYWDGTYIWSYGRASGTLTQHNATTLTAINSYDAPDRGGISFGGAMAAGGGLFYAISAADEVQGFDPAASPDISWTADLAGTSAYDLLYAGSLLFVQTNTGIVVLDPSDGTIVASYADGYSTNPFIDGGDVVYEVGGTTLRWLDGATGAVSREITSPTYGALVGATDGQLVFSAPVSSSIGTTRLYSVISSLAGYTIVVAQISETVGAGHEAEIIL